MVQERVSSLLDGQLGSASLQRVGCLLGRGWHLRRSRYRRHDQRCVGDGMDRSVGSVFPRRLADHALRRQRPLLPCPLGEGALAGHPSAFCLPAALFAELECDRAVVEVLQEESVGYLLRDLCAIHQSHRHLLSELAALSGGVKHLDDRELRSSHAPLVYEQMVYVRGIRIVFTTSSEVARAFASFAEGKANALTIQDFTDQELQRYLVDGDLKRWHEIPPDVRAIVRRPLLANLFRKSAQHGIPRPDTEYVLFSEYYRSRLVDVVNAKK